MKNNSINNFSSPLLNHSRTWLAFFGVLVIILTFLLLVFFTAKTSRIPGTQSAYGIFLGKGLLDTWEFRNGRVSLSIEDDKEKAKSYLIYIGDQTQIVKAAYPQGENKVSARTLQSGKLSEISDGMFVEVYLQNSYQDITRVAKTIIYWE